MLWPFADSSHQMIYTGSTQKCVCVCGLGRQQEETGSALLSGPNRRTTTGEKATGKPFLKRLKVRRCAILL